MDKFEKLYDEKSTDADALPEGVLAQVTVYANGNLEIAILDAPPHDQAHLLGHVCDAVEQHIRTLHAEVAETN